MVFLELRRDSRVTTGNSGCLLCWPRHKDRLLPKYLRSFKNSSWASAPDILKIIRVGTKDVHFKVIQDDSCVLVCPEIHVIFFNLTELVAKNIEMFFLKKS